MAKQRGGGDTGWRQLSPSGRAMIARNRIDWQMIAVEIQHERLVAHCRAAHSLVERPVRESIAELADVDFFLTAVRRFHRAAEIARRCDTTGALRRALPLFDGRVKGVTSIRDALEHMDKFDGIGLSFSRGPDGWTISNRTAMIDTRKVYAAVCELHAAIRAVVDPIAIQDVHGGHPLIELHASSPLASVICG